MAKRRFGLTAIVLSAVSLVVISTWALLSIISVKTAERALISQKRDEARRLVQGMQGILKQGGTPEILDPLISGLRESSGLESLVIVDGRGVVLLARPGSAGPDPRLGETLAGKKESYLIKDGFYFMFFSPLTVRPGEEGAIRLSMSLQREKMRVRDFNRSFFAYFILDFALLLLIGALLLSRLVVTPVKKLLTATQRIADGDLSMRVHVPGSIEIAELSDSFNRMAATLLEKREEVERHVRSLEETNRNLQAARQETTRAEKMASVGLLAAGTAHEIGTPLAAVLGYAEILCEELKDDPDRRDYARRLGDEARRIDRIVKELIDFARPRTPTLELVDLVRLVRETAEILEGQGGLRGIAVTVAATGVIPAVEADPYQLQQVFINLMINARDAMPQGGGLSIAVSGDGGSVTVRVADGGSGIPAELLPKIFDPFFTTKEPGKGTGLGLAISARIIDSFGGTIRAESGEGTGTTFIITLPAGGRQ